MKRHRQGRFSWLTFDSLGDVAHGVFVKEGAPSKEEAAQALGFDRYLSLKFRHGKRVVEHQGGVEADGVMTDQPGVALIITHADCQAALFYDPKQHAIAAVHCGWRGNVANIYQETVAQMGQRYGTRPEDLKVAISPSLGPEAAEFRHYKTELPSAFLPFQVKPTYFDLWEISRWQLAQLGVKQVEFARLCTYHTPEDFFSYRRNGTKQRNITVLGLPH